jgi:nucleotide-binding universal stress UspA family protein
MFNRILVPTDFSPPSAAALEYARILAQTYGSAIWILHVINDPSAESEFVADSFAPSTERIREELTREARQRLACVMNESDCERYQGRFETVIGQPADEITAFASAINADLIVMGTHGRTGLAHLLMGSVAEHVVRSASCPVLTVRQRTVAEETLPVAVDVGAPLAFAV